MKTIRLSVLLLFLVAGGLSSATSHWGLKTLEQLTKSAPVIILGTVKEVKSEIGKYAGANDFIFTYVTMAVQRSLKGSGAGHLTIKVHGGQIGDRVTAGEGSFQFSENEEVLLFLVPCDRSCYEVYSISGKLSVIVKGDGEKYFDTSLLREDEVSKYGHASSMKAENIVNRVNWYLGAKGGN